LKEKPTFSIYHGWNKNEENQWEIEKQKVLPNGIYPSKL
jgi:hypothetical protein